MKSIILFSGGIDSLLTWHLIKQSIDHPIALILDYGQPEEEVNSALDLVNHYNIDYKLDSISLPFGSDNRHKTNYIPCRNGLMLLTATSYAIKENANTIGIGINADDYDDYPDCRKDFIKDMISVINHYTSCDVYLDIQTPLINCTKTNIIKSALEFDLALELTHTCYTPIDGLSCGTCNACKLRLKSFAELGKKDPIKYV